MQSVSSQLDQAFRRAIKAALDIDAEALISVSQNEKFGDYQSNAAMGLAKQVAEKTGQKTNPRAIAEQIKANLNLGDMADAEEVTIAGPGFINVRLSPAWLNKQLQIIVTDERLGIQPTSNPQKVVVDYSGPNIAKEMHVGHLRSTIIGDAVARLIEFRGDTVIRQNHIGDWGTQFGKVILAIWTIANSRRRGEPEFLRQFATDLAAAVKQKNDAARKRLVEEAARRHQENLDADPEGRLFFEVFLNQYEPSLEELQPIYQAINAIESAPEAEQILITHKRHGERKLSEQSKLVTSFLQKGGFENHQEFTAWKKVRDATMESVQKIYDRLGVSLKKSDERGESAYNDDLPKVVAELRRAGLAVESEGAIAVFVDGQDKPPLIIEKSGSEGYLYGTTDLAAIRYRVNVLKASRIIYFVDSRQANHFAQVFATARKAGWADGVSLEYAPFGTMLGEDGRPFKSRSGDNVKLKDLLDEAEERAFGVVNAKNPDLNEAQRKAISRSVGIGAIKYADLSKDRISDYVFSFDAMLALDGNTAVYLQYAHARVMSIFRKGGVSFASISSAVVLAAPHEIALAKHLLRLGEVVELVARELKPHYLCTYLYELAAKFSGFFENCPVLQSEEPIRSSRLALCQITGRTLALGLDLLGISHPDQM
jgi:arginyl-tRNA synthetase